MKEIEVKILDVTIDQMKDKLVELGAKKIFDNEVLTQSFVISEDQSLRVRKMEEQIRITHKKKIESTEGKIREETEVDVSSFEDAVLLLEKLQFKKQAIHKKKRISYMIQSTRIEFDTFLEEDSFVPPFMEIESPSLEELHDIVKALGFSKDDCKAWSAKEVLEYYSSKKA